MKKIKKNDHQEHATEPCQLHMDVPAPCDSVILCFHGVSNLYMVYGLSLTLGATLLSVGSAGGSVGKVLLPSVN